MKFKINQSVRCGNHPGVIQSIERVEDVTVLNVLLEGDESPTEFLEKEVSRIRGRRGPASKRVRGSKKGINPASLAATNFETHAKVADGYKYAPAAGIFSVKDFNDLARQYEKTLGMVSVREAAEQKPAPTKKVRETLANTRRFLVREED